MSREDRGMIDVELLDGAPEGFGGEVPVVDPAARRRFRRRSAVVAGVVLAALGAATLWGTSEGRRDDARVEAVADLPGFAASVRDPLVERWSTTGFVSDVGGLVLSHQEADGERRTVARDTWTGELRWARTEPVAGAGRPLCTGAAVDASGRSLLVCEVAGGGGQTAPNTDAVLGEIPDRLVVLDAADGSVRAVRDLDSRTIGWAVLDDDVVIARRVGGSVRVERSRVLSGERVWTADLALDLGTEVLVRHLALAVRDGLVVVTGPSAGVVAGTDGTVLGTWSAPREQGVAVRVETSAVGFLVWESPGAAIWFDRAGAAGANVPGEPVATALDDGSAPQVVLVGSGTGLRAVDVHVGPLWEAAPTRRVLVRVAGLAVLQDTAGVRVVEVRTGEELWSVALDPAAAADLAPVTDGVRLLVASPGTGTDVGVLTTYDLRSGSVRWTAPLPGGLASVAVRGDGAVGVLRTGQLTILG